MFPPVHFLIVLFYRGARESWRKSNNELHQVGFAITESTSVSVKNAVPVTNNAAKPKMVSFSGGGSFDQSLPVPPPAGKPKMVSFSGGFNLASSGNNSAESTANGSNSTFNTSTTEEVHVAGTDESNTVVIGESDDGGAFLFSTGN